MEETKEEEVEVKGVKRPPRAQRFLGRERRREERQQRGAKGRERRKEKEGCHAARRGKSFLRSRAIEVLGKEKRIGKGEGKR